MMAMPLQAVPGVAQPPVVHQQLGDENATKQDHVIDVAALNENEETESVQKRPSGEVEQPQDAEHDTENAC